MILEKKLSIGLCYDEMWPPSEPWGLQRRKRVMHPVPDYAPFKAGPFRLVMGLAPLDLWDWIEIDAQFAAELGEKEHLLRERHADVFAVLPEATESASEVLALLAAHLPARFPRLYQRAGDDLYNRVTGHRWDLANTELHPLDLSGRLVQEDLCLMAPDRNGDVYRLIGASVCFPTRWRLAEKMGQALDTIHAPVPGYEEQLASTMDRFFRRLKTERPVWRVNWSLVDDPALFQPAGHGWREQDGRITAHNAGENVWLRMERQTLRRLPRTGVILFTIRVYVRSLQQLAANPARAADLAAAIRALPAAMRLYKSLAPFREVVLEWLDHVAGTACRSDAEATANPA